MTPEQLDALAAWWRAALEAQRATLTPGGPGWADLQAKLAIVRQYQWSRSRAEREVDAARDVEMLGWVMQRLAHAHHIDHPERDGWIDSWRPEA